MSLDVSSKLPHDTTGKLLRWLPRLVNLLLLTGIAWLVYQLVLQFIPNDARDTLHVTDIETATAPAVRQETGHHKIADWHLFGESADLDETESTSRIPTHAPETRLKLSLKGIVATDDHTLGYAIIQKPDKEEKHFKVQDSVFGLATLEEIYVDRVILKRNGSYETLRLPVEFIAGDLDLERRRQEEIKRVVTDYRDTFLSRDGMELIKLFGFKPAYKNASFTGFIVTAMGDKGREMMQTIGVEEGDLITAVNGLRFSETIDAVEQLKDLKAAASVDFIIERNGSDIPFHLDFEVPEGASVDEKGQIVMPDTGEDPNREPTEEELGVDYGETDKHLEFTEKQRARSTGSREAVEFDH